MRLRDSARVIVVDLGFGDAGKGTVTDFLVRQTGARAVVRFNGGAQAGHNVVTDDGRHHTFAQLGAASFVPAVRTFLSKHVVFHPTALLVEAEHLARAGVRDALERITVSDECLVTTPFHQAATCVRELSRGDARHGSCGVGVGETVQDALRSPSTALRARDLRHPARLLAMARDVQARKRAELRDELSALPATDLAHAQRHVLEDSDVLRAWVEQVRAFATLHVIEDDARLHHLLAGSEPVVFEGAQGVLLDEWAGFHPFTTWSTCTFENALSLLSEHGSAVPPFKLGVLRTYATRHGAGPFPTASRDLPPPTTVEHNAYGPWQGHFRSGWLDALLLRYALGACGGVDGLALTHLDRFPPGTPWKIATDYRVEPRDESLFAMVAGRATALRPGAPRDLAHTGRLGVGLGRVSPSYRVADGGCAADEIEAALGASVALRSSGAAVRDKALV